MSGRPTRPLRSTCAPRTSSTNDDYTTHLVVLGGVDWNIVTSSVLSRLSLPVRQVTDWAANKMPYFEVTADGKPVQYESQLKASRC